MVLKSVKWLSGLSTDSSKVSPQIPASRRARITRACIVVIAFGAAAFFDEAVVMAARETPAIIKAFFQDLTEFTEPTNLLSAIATLLVLTTLFAFVVRRSFASAFAKLLGFVLVSGVFALLVAILAKVSIGRARPTTLTVPDMFFFSPFSVSRAFESFPSAQAALSGAVCYCIVSRLPGWRVVALGMMVLIGLSRIVTEQHWPTDVLGGCILGWLCAAIILPLFFKRPSLTYNDQSALFRRRNK